MVSLANGSGNRSGGYTFEDDSDEPSDSAPLMSRQPASESATTKHIHIVTGYLSAIEAVLLLCYTGSLVAITQYDRNHTLKGVFGLKYDHDTNWLVVIFCMIHSLVWVAVAVMDRIVQWRHQVIRRNGYLKFYRQMKTIRRVPLFAISLGTAVLLMFVSFLYLLQKNDDPYVFKNQTATFVMYLIVGVEMAVTIPCLVYYFIKCVVFNCQKPPPDVIQDTSSSHGTPTNTLTTVGFRDGEDIDELLERQSDMIRYLQQHNASLGRRIMELQSRVPPE